MRYLLMIQLRADSGLDRVRRDVPQIVQHLSRYSGGNHEIAYRSSDGLTFGFLFQSDEDPGKLQSTLTAGTHWLSGDGMIVVEVGDLKAGLGSSRAWTWLQRHP